MFYGIVLVRGGYVCMGSGKNEAEALAAFNAQYSCYVDICDKPVPRTFISAAEILSFGEEIKADGYGDFTVESEYEEFMDQFFG